MTSTTRQRASHYKRIVVPERGSPEVLQIVESVLRAPTSGGVRVNVLDASVSKPDVEARYGYSPFEPGRIPFITTPFPFVPGYAIVGVVAAAIGLGLITAGIRWRDGYVGIDPSTTTDLRSEAAD